ncbi:MAG: hypothetical protein CO098_17350, partial [Bacteroidetes bacterium CG_4_9_14_3_um_filter_41_19]
MKTTMFTLVIAFALMVQCSSPTTKPIDYSSVSQVKTGAPVSVMLTSYSTTLLATGSDPTRLRIAITDSLNREITSATNPVQLFVSGDGKVTALDGS